MTQLFDSAAEPRVGTVDVPLSERPLIGDDQNTVISAPEKKSSETPSEATPQLEALKQKLFPAGGVATGDESGVRLAHFEIRERLGSGGMGAVFRATDLELARDVALKILHPISSGDSSLVARFRNEGRACAHLNHDNIARVYYAGHQDGLHFIAYELADGSTIKDLIQKNGRLIPEETINYAIQVSLALNHIAAAGIVHRDIKPSNIMLTESGRVKVVDLGLARRDVTDSIGDITVAGTTLGTFDYIAPEQARDPRNADIRSDIYSLGCTMYHMLTGQPPYPDGTALQKLLDHQGKSPPNPRSINAAISPELTAVIRKMMANSPDHRYQAPGLLLSDLLHVAHLHGLQSIPAEGIIWKKRDPFAPRQPAGALWVFASVLLICLTAVILHRFPARPPAAVAMTDGDEELGSLITEDPFIDSPTAPVRTTANSTGASASPAQPSVPDSTTTVPAPAGGTSDSTAIAAASAGDRPMPIPMPVPGPAWGVLSPAILQMTIQRTHDAAATATGDQGPFVLQTEDATRRSYRTLHGAVADARSGDVILLRYNGYPADIYSQPPVRIVGMNLIIRAAEGFRPTLEFDGAASGSSSRTEMFTLRRGTLTIRDIDLRMVTREEPDTDRWCMFRLDGANRIQLENVSLDCRNRTGHSASVFDLVDASVAADESAAAETSIGLNRVICRGTADGFRIAGQPQGRIDIRDSAFALAGHLVQDLGSATMLQPRGNLELSLDHVSLILNGSFLNMRDSDELTGRGAQRMLPLLTIRSDACVFASAQPGGSLIFSTGNSYPESMESALVWNGFTNFYSRYGLMWQIDTAALEYNSRKLDMPQWKQYWQTRADGEENSPVELSDREWVDAAWMSAGNFGADMIGPGSFQLNTASFRPGPSALPLGRDGRMAGVSVNELPSFPSVPASAPSETPPSGVPSGDMPTPIPMPMPEVPRIPASANP